MSASLTFKEYYHLKISIYKAFKTKECPVKEKHIKTIIFGTFRNKGANALWTIIHKKPISDNRTSFWKFCHVLHNILREGHHLCLQHSMRHRNMITEMGKLWGHLNDGYGLCIKQYTKLLVTKLNFHDRNPRFPGSLVLKRGELDQIAANDINVYFQLAVEMFDYLDDIVALQATIFNSLNNPPVSLMSTAAQCRLAPLVCCVQDSNQLYDFCVRLMFRLHANLPDDLLNGHRERFQTLFKQLNAFYLHAKELQYFVDLIKVPTLPANPPNFLIQ